MSAVIAGLGGRPITKASLHRLFDDAAQDRLQALTFLDLNRGLLEEEVRRLGDTPSGRYAEESLREVGVVAARAG